MHTSNMKMSPTWDCIYPVEKYRPVALGKRKRDPVFITPMVDDLDVNPEAWVEIKRQRTNMHDCIAECVHMDDYDQYLTAPNHYELRAALELDRLERNWVNKDGKLVDDRFYRNTDFWMVGELSNKLEYSGALFSNSQFAIEQMEIRLAQLEQQNSETEEEVPEATQNGLLANVVLAIQRLVSLHLPGAFFG